MEDGDDCLERLENAWKKMDLSDFETAHLHSASMSLASATRCMPMPASLVHQRLHVARLVHDRPPLSTHTLVSARAP